MSDMILNEQYWMQDFAVTDGDVTRLYASLQQTQQPQKAMSLLAQVVRRKLEKESLELDTQQRHKSVAAAKKLLQDHTVQVYRQTEEYEKRDRLLVTWRGSRRDEWYYGVGEVIKKKVASEPHYRWVIRLRFANGTERTYIAGTDLNHPQSRKLGLRLFDIQTKEEQPLDKVADQVLHVYGSILLPHLLGRLDEDNRFVRWASLSWLAESLPELPEDTLYRVASYLWSRGVPSTMEALLQVLGLPVDEPHQLVLNLALVADERFKNDGTEAAPQWVAHLPDHLLRLADGTLLDLSMPPNDLWVRYHALFRRPLPEKWADNPHVLTFGGRWLLDVLLVPLKDNDLIQVRDYLDEQDQAVSDVDILRELFHITSRDDAFDRWRFALSYRLNQEAKELGVEFVGFDVVIGSDVVWSWALQKAPFEKPEHHRRLPGTEGLPIEYVEVDQVAAELTRDDEPLEVPPEEPQEEWKPTRQTWEYVLTYYHWDNGVLPYNRQAREMIPPLSEGQRRAILYFVAEQVDDEPFEVVLCTDSGKTWLQSMGLKDLFAGYCRVPGARIWIDRTEELGLYKIRYRPAEPRHRRLLFFEEGRVRPVIKEVEIDCEVDETMLLAEGRYSNIEALDRLDLADRRTASKVLARVFELIGLKDESRDVYCACVDDLFPLLSITKPYSRDYVNQILFDRKNYPWFYSDEEREAGWFVYDPEQVRKKEKKEQIMVQPPQPRPPRSTDGVWGEVAKLIGHPLVTLDKQNPFRILEVTDTLLRILVGRTGQRRTIRRQEIEDASQHLVSQGELSRSEIHAHYSEFNPAYVAAILAALPGVSFATNPIRLSYGEAASKPIIEFQRRAFEAIDWGRFVQQYHATTGHWAIVPRVVFFNESGINSAHDALRLLVEEFTGRVWSPRTKHEYTQRMLQENTIVPRGPVNKVSDAHARIRDNLFRYLGFAFLETGGPIVADTTTPMGYRFLTTTSLEERRNILEQQLLKLHFWNPVVPEGRYGRFRVLPFVFLLRLLAELDNHVLRTEEYNLFVARVRDMGEMEHVLHAVSSFRQLKPREQQDLVRRADSLYLPDRRTSLYHEVDQMRRIVFDLYAASTACQVVDSGNAIAINDEHRIQGILEVNRDVEYRHFANLDDWINYFGSEHRTAP